MEEGSFGLTTDAPFKSDNQSPVVRTWHISLVFEFDALKSQNDFAEFKAVEVIEVFWPEQSPFLSVEVN